MYYAFIQNNKINGCGQCQCVGEGIQSIEITEEVFNDIDKYIWDGKEVVINPNWEEEQQQKEQERINNLTMTPLDFIGVLQSLGLTLEQINTYLEGNLSIKMQLTYRSDIFCDIACILSDVSSILCNSS